MVPLSCCGTRHIPCRRCGCVICRPRPLVRLPPSATGSGRLTPRNLTCGSIPFSSTYKKQIPQKGYLLFGAGNRNRTGTDFTPRDFLTTIAFATRLVCGLDHAFTCSRWSVSGLYTFQGASLAWLGVATIKGFTEFTDIQNSHPWLSALFFDR